MTADAPRDAASAPLPPVFQPLHPDDPREVGGYRLFARLGAGGMGRVYLSYTPGGRPVALKVVRPEFAEDGEFRRRFAQEVTNAQRIHGLYTAQVIDSGLDADAPWLVTAYVPGPSLQQVVRENGALPVRTVLLLMGGIAEALQAIHSVEVVHRDLKPANVLVAGDGPRVIDFGIARAADATALTGTGYRIGSPAFMSPEQAQGRTVTPATDVFALGALAAYVAGGAPPFGDGPDTAVLYRVVHEQPELDAVPADLRELILRCLAKSPEDRPKPAEIIEIARNHPSVGGQLRFTDDWLPKQVNTEITRRSDLPKTPPTPLPAAPAAPPAPAGPPTAPPQPTHPATAVSYAAPQPPVTPPAGFTPPPLGAYGAPQPATEAPTGPVLPSPPTVQLRQEPPSYDTPPPGPVVTDTKAAAPEPRRKGVSWKVLLSVALVMAVGGTVGGVVLVKQLDDKKGDDKANTAQQSPANQPQPAPTQSAPATTAPSQTEDPSPTAAKSTGPSKSASPTTSPTASPTTSATRPPKYGEIYKDQVLTIPPNANYEFDLKNGKVVPTGTADWKVGTYGAEFRLSDKSDAYIAKDNNPITPESCASGIDREPAANFKFDNLPVDRQFCVRQRATGSIVVLKVVKLGDSDGAATLSLTYYRNDG
ncbi:serine/threonine-protein kinase [Streptomyces sp. CB01881]|uniref:serine/threonine-protein kinase n=1 Tax=Streptomyces sp. CB01881 TaxID=2078691 RepID=UPI00188476D7|nr:serine/threonine-protein kinase [Streptomyces sp. CB01881]